MTKTGYLPRYRFPTTIIWFAVFLHIYLKSRTVIILLFFLFRVKVTHKTVCEWAQKFYTPINPKPKKYSKNKTLICHVDEKFINIQGIQHYWWSLKDYLGDTIHHIITPKRDLYSAKRLMKETRQKINRDVDIIVRDGLPAYNKAAKYLGNKCKSVIAGINGRGFLFQKKFFWLTNNPIESLNSEIDFYLGRFQDNFTSLESARRYASIFMLQKYLRRCFNEGKLSEASSTLIQAIQI